MSNPLERYQKLRIKASQQSTYKYQFVCKELSFILRNAYNKLPKTVQSLIYDDTLAAFRLLPEMQTQNAVSAAFLLLRSAEAVLPKQKRSSATSEFKHAKVVHKRRCKARQQEQGSTQLPVDVLVHIFSFLDLKSLATVGLVCWFWNLAASDNTLWQSQYVMIFGNCNSDVNERANWIQSGILHNKTPMVSQEETAFATCTDWRAAFKKAYLRKSSKRLTSNRGYCGHCDDLVWLDGMKCSQGHSLLKSRDVHINPLLPHQIAIVTRMESQYHGYGHFQDTLASVMTLFRRKSERYSCIGRQITGIYRSSFVLICRQSLEFTRHVSLHCTYVRCQFSG